MPKAKYWIINCFLSWQIPRRLELIKHSLSRWIYRNVYKVWRFRRTSLVTGQRLPFNRTSAARTRLLLDCWTFITRPSGNVYKQSRPAWPVWCGRLQCCSSPLIICSCYATLGDILNPVLHDTHVNCAERCYSVSENCVVLWLKLLFSYVSLHQYKMTGRQNSSWSMADRWGSSLLVPCTWESLRPWAVCC